MMITPNNIPQGYKATPLGVIPQEWKVKRLGEISVSISSGKNKHKDREGKYPVYGSTGIIGFSSEFRYEGEAILVARVGANAGILNLVSGKYDVSDNTLVVITKSNLYNYYFAYNQLVYCNLNRLVFGSGQPLITSNQLKNITIPVPPLAEQKKIAEVLGVWDKAIEKQSQLIEQLTLRKRGLMQQLLTAKRRLPGFSDPWKKVRLGDIADLYQPQTIQNENLSQTGYPVYGANGFIGYYNKFNHELPQVVITCRGASCGTVNYTPKKCWITGNAMVLNVDNNQNINKDFFYYLISKSSFVSLISGSGQPQIVRQPLLKYELYIPLINEQTAIAQVLTAADREIELAQQKLELLHQQKRGLMQQLLTGKKRVKY